MDCQVWLNGEYDEISQYSHLKAAQLVVCADGGTEHALQLGLLPDLVIGDMDSVSPESLQRLQNLGVIIKTFASEKDDTDAQLALQEAVKMGADNITILGGTGKRLDHTWSNIMSTITLVERGIRVRFYKPGELIYIISNENLTLSGEPGHIISLLALTPAQGVTTAGLKYPLIEAELRPEHPYAVSNEFIANQANISVKSGVLMVVHITG